MLLTVQALQLVRSGQNIGIPLSFHTVRGDLMWIRGANGAGKSTLLQVLAGLLPSTGSETLRWTDPQPTMFYLGHQLGMVEGFTAFEHCHYHPALAKPASDKVMLVLKALGLDSFAQHECTQLSRGQQQRLAMAVCVLSDTTLWLLDEPFTGLDKPALLRVMSCIQAHQVSGAALVVSHQDISDAATHTITVGEGAYEYA